MKRTIKFKQNQRRRQQREGWELNKQRPKNTSYDDGVDYVSDIRNHISPKMAREMEYVG